ncbi:MAG: RNA polymerase sporulation sigma factor SigH [Firmicutes bacterium]|jgi:RNA polymerase sporulation-specific sigma factor|nr:RNA polymerase sporulation sigma factor SigH [Bacillota bacterium]
MEIRELHILTDEQLVRMAQEGSETAEEILIEKYKNLVKSKAKLYYIVGADNEDVVQEGMIGLFKAIRGYDGKKEASFKTYAQVCIDSQIITAIKRANRLKHQPLNESISISKEVDEEDKDATLADVLRDAHGNEPEEQMLVKEVVQFLQEYDNGLFSDFEWSVWMEKLKGKDYVEIAHILNKSPKSIDNALQRIKKKILAYLES